MEGRRPLRIAVLQFTPHHGKPGLSRKKVESLCSSIRPGSIDLLVAPEMALTGYVFKAIDEVVPLCEEVGNQAATSHDRNTTISLAQDLSRRLQCYTVMGFPEIVKVAPGPFQSPEQCIISPPFDARPDPETPATPIAYPAYYNSAILTSPSGTILHTCRKHFLFETDQVWSSPGAGFQYIDLPDLGGSRHRIALAICMDLNPFQFQTEWDKMELTRFCDDNQVDLLVVPMAWLRGEVEGSRGREEDGDVANSKVVNYWAGRCEPLWEKKVEGKARQTLLVTSNRTGTEDDSTFAGSSSVLHFEHGRRPRLLASLGETQEGLLLWDGQQDDSEEED